MDKITEEKIAAAAKSFANGATLKEVRGITNDELEAVYSLGFGYYTTGKFEEAQKLFEFLVLFDHLSTKYWFALGAVQQAARGGVLSRARRQGERGERDNGARALLPGEYGPRTRIPRQGRRAPQGDRRGRIQD